jgi:hypothetical protein
VLSGRRRFSLDTPPKGCLTACADTDALLSCEDLAYDGRANLYSKASGTQLRAGVGAQKRLCLTASAAWCTKLANPGGDLLTQMAERVRTGSMTPSDVAARSRRCCAT